MYKNKEDKGTIVNSIVDSTKKDNCEMKLPLNKKDLNSQNKGNIEDKTKEITNRGFLHFKEGNMI